MKNIIKLFLALIELETESGPCFLWGTGEDLDELIYNSLENLRECSYQTMRKKTAIIADKIESAMVSDSLKKHSDELLSVLTEHNLKIVWCTQNLSDRFECAILKFDGYNVYQPEFQFVTFDGRKILDLVY